MKIFDNPVPILLNAGNPVLESPHVTVGALTSKVAIRIQRPTTAVPVNWDANGTVSAPASGRGCGPAPAWN